MRFEPGPLRLLTPKNLIPPLIYEGAIWFAAIAVMLLRGSWYGVRSAWHRRRRIWAEY